MNLITEQLATPLEFITEASADGKKKYCLEGIFLQANLKNGNGRIYPSHIMEREVNKYSESHIAKNRAFGELGHPATPNIGLDRVSHLCTELKRDGDNWVGKATILETPMGMIARNILDGGGVLGTSSRGLGSLKKNNQGLMEVQDDFSLRVAGDIVADPSAPNAFLNGVMEGQEWILASSGEYVLAEKLAETIEEIKQETHKLPKSQFNEQALVAWTRFLQRLTET